MLATIPKHAFRVALASTSPRRIAMMQLMKVDCTVVESKYPENLDRAAFSPEDFVMLTSVGKAAEIFEERKEFDIVISGDTMIVAPLPDNGTAASVAGPAPTFISAATILGKPKSADEGRQMLRRLSGRTHTVVTGVTILARLPAAQAGGAIPSRTIADVLARLPQAVAYTSQPADDAVATAVGLLKVQPAAASSSSSSAAAAAGAGAGAKEDGAEVVGKAVAEKAVRITFYEKTEVVFDDLSDAVIESYIECGEYSDKAGAYGIQGLGGSFVRSIRGCYFNVVGFPFNHFAREFRSLVTAMLPSEGANEAESGMK